LAAAGWFGREVIRNWLTQRIKFEFDTKLTELGAKLRDGEERLKADLRAKEAEISALRTGALTAIASRQAALDQRRLEAVDQIWSAVHALGPARGLMQSMSVLKYEHAAEAAEKDPRARMVFEAFGKEEVLLHLDTSSAHKARPYVTEPVWAAYSALSALCYNAILRWHTLKNGLGRMDLVKNEAVAKLIKAALPHQAGLIDKWGPSEWYYFGEELESKLIEELRVMLSGTETNEEQLRQSAEVIKLASELAKQNEVQ
jgi:hypothetical protein